MKCPQVSHGVSHRRAAGQCVSSGVNLCLLLPGSLEVYYTKARKKEKCICQPFEGGLKHKKLLSKFTLLMWCIYTYVYSLSLLFPEGVIFEHIEVDERLAVVRSHWCWGRHL